jgi:predicted negative regulator of RcsB-dependent stress response
MMAIGVLFRNWRVCFTLLLALALPSALFADDDQIIQKNGTKIFGHIVGVSDGQVTITSKASNGSPVTLPYMISDIKSVIMAPPPEVLAAKGQQPAQVVASLAPLVKSYAGLPADWVLDAMGQLADAYTSLNQDDQASAIYAQINQLYPNSPYTNLAVSGQAKVLLAQKQLDQALTTIQPIIDVANKTVAPSAPDARAYASAFLVYGQILEAQQKLPEALEAYLTVKTMFYQNQALVDQSNDLVKNLKALHPDVSVN